MNKLWLLAASTLLIANLALLGSPLGGEYEESEPDRVCACVDGSGPDPEPPYVAACLTWYYKDCELDSECRCEPE